MSLLSTLAPVAGDLQRVDALIRTRLDSDVGAAVAFEEVLLVGNGDQVKVGAPLVSGAKVKATVVSHGRGDKVTIFKMRRRKHFQKHQGHRQNYTEVRIDEITS